MVSSSSSSSFVVCCCLLFVLKQGLSFVLEHLDGRELIITTPPGKVIKPNEVMVIDGEGACLMFLIFPVAVTQTMNLLVNSSYLFVVCMWLTY